MDCQQTRPVIHRLLNKTPDFPGSEIKASVICTILSLFNLVKPVKTHQQKHAFDTNSCDWRYERNDESVRMTNCWLTGGDTGRFTGASTRDRGRRHNTSADIWHIASVPVSQHVSTSALHDSLLHPLLHFTFVLAAAAPRFDGFREMVFTESACKTLCRAGASAPMI